MKYLTIDQLYQKFLQAGGVSIDTRSITKGDMFFALKGPNFDANQYAHQALEQGASFAVVDDASVVSNDQMLLVENCEMSLQALARHHRKQFDIPVIGLTGSNGKTTTKELINVVMASQFVSHATVGNLNNHLGVPLTLLRMKPETEIAIIEMGANHVGEIAMLCEITLPTHGLITNIGEAHTELFGGIEGVLRGKSELFDFLKKTGGIPFINQLDFRLANMTKRFNNSVNFPAEDLNFKNADPYVTVELSGITAKSQLIGKYNFPNIAAAIAMGRHFQMSDQQILEAICTYMPQNQRSQIITKGSITIISDCYNANPTSMQAALENLSQMSGKKAVILGEMKEVEDSRIKHQKLIDHVREIGVEKALFIGKEFENFNLFNSKEIWFSSASESENYLNNQIWEDFTILIKGSRSNKLDVIIPCFDNRVTN